MFLAWEFQEQGREGMAMGVPYSHPTSTHTSLGVQTTIPQEEEDSMCGGIQAA